MDDDAGIDPPVWVVSEEDDVIDLCTKIPGAGALAPQQSCVRTSIDLSHAPASSVGQLSLRSAEDVDRSMQSHLMFTNCDAFGV